MSRSTSPDPSREHSADRHDLIRVQGAAGLVAARSTLTGEHLAAFVGSRPKKIT